METYPRVTTIGFDADDTLWHNERFYRLTEERFAALLAEHAAPGDIKARLLEAEKRNLRIYGFGIKGFTLSMIETAVEITGERVPGAIIAQILAVGRDMLAHPVETFPEVRATLTALTGRFRMVLITKGDLFDQERKLAASGLGDLFDAIEIVSDKTPEIYRRIFNHHGDGAARSMMVGNSVKSDILPAIEAGAYGVHVPHDLTWEYEHAHPPETNARYRRIESIGALPALLLELS